MKYFNKILVKIIAVVLTSIIVYLVSTLIFGHCIACDQNQIYGIWGYADSVQSIRLEIREDNKVFFLRFYDPDTISMRYSKREERIYRISSLSNDTLTLSDKDNQKYRTAIKEWTDSTIVFENLIDVKGTLTFFGHRSYSEIEPCFPTDSLDYIIDKENSSNILSYRDGYVNGYQLSKKQISVAFNLMRECAEKDSVSSTCYVKTLFPLDWYIRQYAGYINNEGHVIVVVSLVLNDENGWGFKHDEEHKKYLYTRLLESDVRDGGESYASAIIDLTSNRVLYFKTHGVA